MAHCQWVLANLSMERNIYTVGFQLKGYQIMGHFTKNQGRPTSICQVTGIHVYTVYEI